MKKTITIISPAYNEQDGIVSFLSCIDKIAFQLKNQFDIHVAVLNDGSRDSTSAIANNYCAQYFDLTVCNFTRNFGKEAAIVAGIERYRSDAYIIMDTDLQHPPELIPEMLALWQQGYKVIESVKIYRGKESLVYKLFSKLFYKSLHILSSLQLENHSDFKLLDNEIAEVIRQLPERHRFFRGIVEWLGYPSKQIPFHVPSRKNDSSSWSIWELSKYSINNISSFTSAPLHLVTLIGFLMLIVSGVLGSVAFYQWVVGVAVTGFTTVILLLLFIGSVLMVSLGLIGLYLSRIYDEIKARPLYIIKDEIRHRANTKSNGTTKLTVSG